MGKWNRVIALALGLLLVLPASMASAVPQVVGGSDEENQKLQDYFNNPRSSSIGQTSAAQSDKLVAQWYKAAKEQTKQAEAAATAKYKKDLKTYPAEYRAMLKASYDRYMESMKANEYALDRIYDEIKNQKLYAYSTQTISMNLVKYGRAYMENQAAKAAKGTAASSKQAAPQAVPVTLVINGEKQPAEQSGVMIGGSTLVPLKTIFDKLGARFSYDAATKTIEASKDDRTIRLTVGSDEATVNGQPVKLNAKSQIIDNRTMVPLRVIVETFGAAVAWDQTSRTVTIGTNKE